MVKINTQMGDTPNNHISNYDYNRQFKIMMTTFMVRHVDNISVRSLIQVLNLFEKRMGGRKIIKGSESLYYDEED